jgi:hypothetical protein
MKDNIGTSGRWGVITMTVRLTPHAEELLKAVHAQRQEPVERIVEHALEVLARQEHIHAQEAATGDTQRQAVADMLDFIKHNRVQLGAGLSVKDLIHEGHRI